MSTSTDGGGPGARRYRPPARQGPRRPAGRAAQRHRHRAVRGLNGKIESFRSTTAAPGRGVHVSDQLPWRRGRAADEPAAERRDRPPGNVYVAWEDCRFRAECAANDIVFSRSSDGVNWSPVRAPDRPREQRRGPLHPRPGRRSHDRGRQRARRTDVLLLSERGLRATTCQLDVGYISSPDGGAHWGARPSSPDR